MLKFFKDYCLKLRGNIDLLCVNWWDVMQFHGHLCHQQVIKYPPRYSSLWNPTSWVHGFNRMLFNIPILSHVISSNAIVHLDRVENSSTKYWLESCLCIFHYFSDKCTVVSSRLEQATFRCITMFISFYLLSFHDFLENVRLEYFLCRRISIHWDILLTNMYTLISINIIAVHNLVSVILKLWLGLHGLF